MKTFPLSFTDAFGIAHHDAVAMIAASQPTGRDQHLQQRSDITLVEVYGGKLRCVASGYARLLKVIRIA